jgi:hypothetical protein
MQAVGIPRIAAIVMKTGPFMFSVNSMLARYSPNPEKTEMLSPLAEIMNAKKYRWFRRPTQFPTKGQW